MAQQPTEPNLALSSGLPSASGGAGSDGLLEAERLELRHSVEAMMGAAWRSPGFCVPNDQTYPHQWLWDSCFHALIWLRLDPARALNELDSALAHQGPTGFVPHMTYWSEPAKHVDFWGRRATSSITQPPMYGHAVAEAIRRGMTVPLTLQAGAAAGLTHLLGRRATPAGLVPAFHPWETGCDDSPRWDGWLNQGRGGRFDQKVWRLDKQRMVAALEYDEQRAPVANPLFTVGSIGFSALVAWNSYELASVLDDPATVAELVEAADRVRSAIASRWDHRRRTWVDELSDGTAGPAQYVRTLDAQLALLVDPRPEALADLVDETAFAAPFGPRGVHRQEPVYDPDRYWRGPAWPQLNYLLWAAARALVERGEADGALASVLGFNLINGSARSALAEYWNPETGRGLGARPQTWTGLALCVLDETEPGRSDRGQELVEMGEAHEQ